MAPVCFILGPILIEKDPLVDYSKEYTMISGLAAATRLNANRKPGHILLPCTSILMCKNMKLTGHDWFDHANALVNSVTSMFIDQRSWKTARLKILNLEGQIFDSPDKMVVRMWYDATGLIEMLKFNEPADVPNTTRVERLINQLNLHHRELELYEFFFDDLDEQPRTVDFYIFGYCEVEFLKAVYFMTFVNKSNPFQVFQSALFALSRLREQSYYSEAVSLFLEVFEELILSGKFHRYVSNEDIRNGVVFLTNPSNYTILSETMLKILARLVDSYKVIPKINKSPLAARTTSKYNNINQSELEFACIPKLEIKKQQSESPITPIARCSHEECSKIDIMPSEKYSVRECSLKCKVYFHCGCWRKFSSNNLPSQLVCSTPDCRGTITLWNVLHDERVVKECITPSHKSNKTDKPLISSESNTTAATSSVESKQCEIPIPKLSRQQKRNLRLAQEKQAKLVAEQQQVQTWDDEFKMHLLNSVSTVALIEPTSATAAVAVEPHPALQLEANKILPYRKNRGNKVYHLDQFQSTLSDQ